MVSGVGGKQAAVTSQQVDVSALGVAGVAGAGIVVGIRTASVRVSTSSKLVLEGYVSPSTTALSYLATLEY